MIAALRLRLLTVVLAVAAGACASAPGQDLLSAERSAPSDPPDPAAGETSGADVVCPELDPHPVASAISEDFDADYDDVIEWFCSGHSFEDILLALQTERLAPIDVPALLAEREQGKPWDVIWSELGITAQAPPRLRH